MAGQQGPCSETEVNRLQRSVTRRLNEWRKDQWSATLEFLDPEDQSLRRMTKRVMRFPTPSPPWSPRGESLVRLWESRSPCRQSGDSVSGGVRTFGPGSYGDVWRGAEVLLHDPCQRTLVNKPWWGSGSHQGSQGQQGSGPERYLEQGTEASPTTYGIHPRSDFQSDPPRPLFP